MDKVWHNYPEEKPTSNGYYVVILSWGSVETYEWEDEEFFPNQFNAVIAWAYISDVIPLSVNVNDLGYFYDHRGRKPSIRR